MSIQDAKDGDTEAQADAVADTAEFSGAWDELEAEESGQPSAAEGRQDEEAEGADQEGDEAGQGAEDSSATPDADADEASRGETSDDLWANAPAQLREAFQASETARRKAENLVRSNGARAAQAQNELNALKAALKSQQDASGATEEGEEASDPKERLKQLREEYPDVAAPILDQMAKLEEQVSKLTARHASQEETATADFYAEQLTTLQEQHDDIADIVASPDYAEWVSQQIPAIQNIVAQNASQVVNAAECAFVFDLFKQQTGFGNTNAAESLAEKRRRQLQAGTGVSRQAPPVTRDEPGTYADEWDRLEKADRRKAAGRR